jgi:1,5-anhydro-D-fructose reductase (1,5-anhydro-D-mannitol-forming)
MITTAIIGFGKMGQIRATAIEKVDQAQIKNVFDPNVPDLESKYSVAKSYEEILVDSEIDAVFLCLANYLNKEYAIKALEAGKHVFCEKPPAFNASEVEEIIVAEKKSGKKLMYGFNHRQHGAVIRMKEEIDSGSLGKVLWMRGRYGKSVDKDFYNCWRSNKELAGGGILLDQGIHMLDLFLHFGKHFDDVHAFVSNLYWNLDGIEDNVFAIMRNNKDGIVASLHSTMTQWRHLFSLEVFLEKGYMVLNGLKTSSNTYGKEELTIARNRSKAPAASWDDEERTEYQIDNSWQNEVDSFFDTVINDLPISSGSSLDSLNVMKLIDKIYENETKVNDVLHEDLQAMVKSTN